MAGFTLLETVLALAVLALLAGLALATFYGTLDSVRMKESASRMAALLRTARAQAGNAGKRFRLRFDEQTGQPAVTVEADPLGAPGEWTAYRAWWVEAAELHAGVTVARCELTGPEAFGDLDAALAAQERDEDAPAVVTFRPDGTSDSARILLTCGEGEDLWAVEITLNGIDGTVRQRQFDPEQNEEDAELVEELSERR
ncbi:MAG: GspH/FimT family pseudopilin [Planctomycetota bacterium]